MYKYILISNYNNKISSITESLCWGTFDQAKKYVTLEEAEEDFQSIPLDIVGYFSIGEIIKDEIVKDLYYHWEREIEYLILKRNQEVIKKIKQNPTTIEFDETTLKSFEKLSKCGITLFDNMIKDLRDFKSEQKSE
jgi:hypothetical protein